MIDLDTSAAFLKSIFPDELRQLGVIVLKTWGCAGRTFVLDDPAVLSNALHFSFEHGCELGFGVALRNPGFKGIKVKDGKSIQSQGDKSDCNYVTAVKLDFDSKPPEDGMGPKKPLSSETKAEIVSLLLNHTVKPSLIVDLGGGIHAYL